MFYLLDEKTIRSVVVSPALLLRRPAGSAGIQVALYVSGMYHVTLTLALIPDPQQLQYGWKHEMRGGSRVRGTTGEVQQYTLRDRRAPGGVRGILICLGRCR